MKSEIRRIVEQIKSGDTTARAEVEKALATAKTNEKLHAFLEIFEDEALKRADEIDAKIASGEPIGRLAGVPYAAKDNFLTTIGHTTAAAKILDNFESPIDATAIERLTAEDAILIGKTNLDAFAHGGSTENSAYGPTHNAADFERVAGGSSGGSAVAVAAGIVPFALGSDTGGSIRQPASFNGVVGYKPTYGMIPRYGVVAMASSTDVVGPLTRTVADAELLCDILAGPDGRDSTVLPDYFSLTESITPGENGTNSEIVVEKVDPNSDEDMAKKFVRDAELQQGYLAKLKKLAKDDKVVLFAARIGDEYVGRATLVLSDWKSLEDQDGTSGSDVDIDELYPNLPSVNAVQVGRKFRKLGVASKILEALHDEARVRGYTEIGLGVETDNEPAKNLYEKMGYKIRPSGDKETHRVWWSETDDKGERHDYDIVCYLMIKNLAEKADMVENSIDSSLKIGLVKEFIGDGVDADVRQRTLDFAGKLRAAGHTVEEVDLPMAKYALPIYYIVVPAEVSSNLARYDGVRYGVRSAAAKTLNEIYGQSRDAGFMPENKRRVMIGSYVLSSGYFDAYYLQAQKARTLLINEFNKLFASYDFLIGPTAPTPAFRLGENTADPIKMYLSDIMTVPASLAGLPAISLPYGTDKNGLPIGVQIIGAMRSDARLLRFARESQK